jgi:hypothetical protein
MEAGMHQDGIPDARIFNVRVWSEDIGGGHREWRGRVFDVTSGEARYFRDWSVLVEIVTGSLADTGAADNAQPV